jgi:hypothetical protein
MLYPGIQIFNLFINEHQVPYSPVYNAVREMDKVITVTYNVEGWLLYYKKNWANTCKGFPFIEWNTSL